MPISKLKQYERDTMAQLHPDISAALAKLHERQRLIVLQRREPFNGKLMTIDEIAQHWYVVRQRIYQIDLHARRSLKPYRSEVLREWMERGVQNARSKKA